MKANYKNIAVDGLVKNNPTLKLVLGTCPTLALTTMAMNGIGMGLAVTLVLICSNAIISLLRNIIPNKVRIPAHRIQLLQSTIATSHASGQHNQSKICHNKISFFCLKMYCYVI